MFRFALTLSALVCASAAHADDCRRGDVTFDTDGRVGVLNLTMHERPSEVPAGLFNITGLAPRDGVLGVYPAPRNGRTLNNSELFASDLMTFDAEGRVLTLFVDDTGAALDRVTAGDGMLYVANLAGGTIEAMGFTDRTRLTGWTCSDPAP
jgi:hypothetical protein